MQPPLVGALQPVEHAIDVVGEFFFPAAMQGVMGLEQPRTQHRRQRERHYAGYRNRAHQREREFCEQCAGQSALKADRHVHRAKHNRHRNDRPAQLAGRGDRGRYRRKPVLEMPVDVFNHDDGVVDHETDRQHQRQQGQQIDRIAEGQKDNECTDQRQRNRYGRYQRRIDRAEKHEHDECDDDQGFDQTDHDLVDRGVDELGGIVNDLAV